MILLLPCGCWLAELACRRQAGNSIVAAADQMPPQLAEPDVLSTAEFVPQAKEEPQSAACLPSRQYVVGPHDQCNVLEARGLELRCADDWR